MVGAWIEEVLDVPFYWRVETVPGIEALPRRDRQRLVRRLVLEHLPVGERLACGIPTLVGLALGWLVARQAFPDQRGLQIAGMLVGMMLGEPFATHLKLRRLMPHLRARLDARTSQSDP